MISSVDMKSYSAIIQMKATEEYFSVMLFIMLYKVVLTFEPHPGVEILQHAKVRQFR